MGTQRLVGFSRAWTWAGATVRGTSHEKLGEPRQDSAAAAEIPSHEGSVLALVVCDGAGSASKGDVGSRTACLAAHSIIRSYLNSGNRISQLDRRIGETWLLEIRRQVSAKSQMLGLPIRELATTLTIVMASESHTFILAVGDSPCVIHNGSKWLAPIWPMRGQYANQTFFITQDPIPLWDCAIVESQIDRIAALSDGIDKLVLHDRDREVFAPFFDGIFDGLQSVEGLGRSRQFSHGMTAFLTSKRINDLTDDDKTLIVAARRAKP